VIESTILCAFCQRPHPDHLARYRCSGCEQTVCGFFAHEGRQFHRKGQLVHLVRVKAHLENPPVTKVCGVLARVEDYEAPPAEPAAAPGAIEAPAGPSIEPAGEGLQTALASPGAEG
jgi:hypothetical protein